MKSTDIPRSACSSCSYEMDTASAGDGSGAAPREGDVTFCLNCGALFFFNGDMTTRPATLEDVEGFDPKAAMELGRVRAVIEKRGRFWKDGKRLDSAPTEPMRIYPPGYEEGAQMTFEVVSCFVGGIKRQSGPGEAIILPEFAMPGKEVVLIGSIAEWGDRLARNDEARRVVTELMLESDRRKIDYPTILMLRASLELNAIPITVAPFSELGLEGTLLPIQAGRAGERN